MKKPKFEINEFVFACVSDPSPQIISSFINKVETKGYDPEEYIYSLINHPRNLQEKDIHKTAIQAANHWKKTILNHYNNSLL